VVLGLLLMVTVLGTVDYFATRAYHAREDAYGRQFFAKGEAELQSGRPEPAIAALRVALMYSRENPRYRLRLAEALTAANHPNEARAYLEGLFEEEPGNGVVNLQLAHLAAQHGNVPDAIRYFHAAIYGFWAEEPGINRRQARLDLIDFLLRNKMNTQAQSELVALSADLPNDVPLRLRVAGLFTRVPDYRSALGLYRSVLQLAPGNQNGAAGAGEAAFQLAQYGVAGHYLREAVVEDPKDARSDQLLSTVNLMSVLNPSRRGLTLRKRATRTVSAFTQAGDRLKQCAEVKGQSLSNLDSTSDLEGLYKQWKQMSPGITSARLRRQPEFIDAAMDLVFQIEDQTSRQCGTPTGTDFALLLLSRRREDPER
jgi:tetratricopeptide (TPR) repeat protein